MRLLIILLTLTALLATLTLWRAGHNEAIAEQKFPPEGQFVTVNGRQVHAIVTGTGPDLVLIHGSSGNTRDFTHSFVNLVKDRYRVIVFDRPGLGSSDRLPPGAEGIHKQAAQLRDAAHALGAKDPIVLGQSYGAAVALAWALDAPDSMSAMVNVSGPSHPWDGPLPWLYRVNSHFLGSAFVVPLITAFVSERRATSDLAEVFAPQSMPNGYASHILCKRYVNRDSCLA